ncbi:haloacid dehalogenase-like hydrolase domain protein [Bacteriovorax sp. BSW11_IV]|uniref:HAD hydrolase-like protein n=1 Tax=Bacteriovorax sp. BSW11_IV TaxID=1353529 RepID=UPI000389EB33|nr:HAD hydrolase-like protein [Bacteriovorax sp. BSW11_IV]EQC49957.1 haloacid dehalogenase-like hydrolase domain protein [Bacteriovorax sp. BSW11_IV]
MRKMLIKMKLLGVLVTGICSFNVKASSKSSWIYFDLGDTVINTKAKTGFKYFDGTKEYIERLKDRGYKVGIISNIPEQFGMDYDEKLKTLKEYIAKNWTDDKDFDWTQFDEVFLPLNNSELKPADILYMKAMERADYCPMAYVSENIVEVEKASSMGIAGHLFVDSTSDGYVAVDEIDDFLETHYTNSIPENCL